MDARDGLRSGFARHRRIRFVIPILAALLGLIAAPAGAQTVLSETTWGGAGSEVTNGAAVAADGSTYLAGNTRSFTEFGNANVFVVKFTPAGGLDWQRTWDGPDTFFSDAGEDVALAADGTVYVAGSTLGAGGDALLLRFAPDGTLLSQLRWGSPDGDFGQAVATAADGAVYLVGSTRLSDPGAQDLFVVKFGSDGTLLWQRTWGLLDTSEEGMGVAVGPDGSVFVSSYTASTTVLFSNDIALLKIDPAGNLLWARTYAAGEGTDSRGGVAVDANGFATVAGGFFHSRTSDLDAVVVRFAPDGSLVWDRTWGGRRTGDNPADLAIDAGGNVLLAGQTGQGAGEDDAFLVRFTPDARVTDAVTWGSPSLDGAAGVGVAPTGTISLGATVEAGPPYTLLGAPSKASRARGTVSVSAIPLADAAGTVADAGGAAATPAGSTTFAGGFDAALVRVTLGAANAVAAELEEEEVERNRPNGSPGGVTSAVGVSANPARSDTRLTFALAPETNGRAFAARVVDVAGRTVRAFEGVVRDGVAVVDWDLRDGGGRAVPTGIYFVSLRAGEERAGTRVAVTR